MSAIEPASLQRSAEGVPYSDRYDDVYHAAAGAIAQTRHVFLAGNDLPARWQGRETFTIVETGFGLGNNFLATWLAWKADPHASGRLHFVSVEKHPFLVTDLAHALADSEIPAALTQALLAQWPLPLPGAHRLEFDGGRVVLSLFFGEGHRLLESLALRADAIYLDGFAPAKNPELWSEPVFRALARLSDRDTTLATWSVSGSVREGLERAAFEVEKTPGFSGKREMLRGRYRGARPRQGAPLRRHALIVGAGLAGSAVAERLAARGFTSELLEAREEVAQGASGNLAGAFRPLPSQDDNYLSRITRAGFLYGLQHLAALDRGGHAVLWEDCGVLHLARNAEQEQRQRRIVDTLGAPAAYLDWVSAADATRKAGHTASFGGWWFPQGGWIQPRSLVEANLAAAGERARVRPSTHVARLQQDGDDWLALDEQDREIARAGIVILANAHDARRLAEAEWLPLRAARGQVSHLPMAQLAPLGVVVCGQGYITPGIGGHAALGASFVVDDFDLGLREDEHAENLRKLGLMLPELAQLPISGAMDGRVSLRPVSIDRLPMVGALPATTSGAGYNLGTLPRRDGLWLISGFGARGLVWSSLCAELLASRICAEPLPLESDLADALDPARFVINPPRQTGFAGD
ncbi:MAG: bifunctional tRNA (5-methylaminomethyl-2-thiouridine)(34)-methyltransferase MnmD/FAD-dependent 5-carboxymethylaminomethyl-2-thiouridine(34) oxidoreductase MnmC [Candidatus Dactylopiibacterium sp.]|nr:bifunctional tRNA (5-methylaminomethyl-2-thiouridine)(34)-methyltransferase MnmD/FAD-dependent 5-carboxymethylaminomethyl-2-thiouridine(34) oxidoreductase MnmC [Candidatus Dactylopiibacterium sp.]